MQCGTVVYKWVAVWDQAWGCDLVEELGWKGVVLSGLAWETKPNWLGGLGDDRVVDINIGVGVGRERECVRERELER